jgi:hypothetical protein
MCRSGRAGQPARRGRPRPDRLPRRHPWRRRPLRQRSRRWTEGWPRRAGSACWGGSGAYGTSAQGSRVGPRGAAREEADRPAAYRLLPKGTRSTVGRASACAWIRACPARRLRTPRKGRDAVVSPGMVPVLAVGGSGRTSTTGAADHSTGSGHSASHNLRLPESSGWPACRPAGTNGRQPHSARGRPHCRADRRSVRRSSAGPRSPSIRCP